MELLEEGFKGFIFSPLRPFFFALNIVKSSLLHDDERPVEMYHQLHSIELVNMRY